MFGEDQPGQLKGRFPLGISTSRSDPDGFLEKTRISAVSS